MNAEVLKLWKEELEWIKDTELREKTAKVWELALERSVLSADDLNRIPFTLKVDGPVVTFMEHKRSVVHISKKSAETILEMYNGALPIDMDVLISGAILCDVGKLLEYTLDENGNAVVGDYGKYVRHPFSGVALAAEAGIPAEVQHIIAAHAGEGDMVTRSVEAYIVHHADFMTFLPFKNRLKPSRE